ncbi:MAG: spore coat U domain-containing protein [Hyphomicrobiaceae bacterium]
MLAFCKRLSLVLGTISGLALASNAATAQTTTTDTFDVLITIDAFCAITNPTDLDFGTNTLLNANIDQTSTFEVQCTNTTPFDIGLDQGLNFSATRRMDDGGGNFVSYALYSDAGRTTDWGNTIGTDTVADTGDGTVNPFTVYGRVPTQTTPAPGNYADTVTIEVTY